MTSEVRREITDGIAMLTLAHPPVNIPTRDVLTQYRAHLADLAAAPGLRVLVLLAEGKHFSDFNLRFHLLGRLVSLSVEEILAQGTDGMAKLYVIQSALKVRRCRPESFGPEGVYQPLQARGPKAQHAVGYLRGGGV